MKKGSFLQRTYVGIAAFLMAVTPVHSVYALSYSNLEKFAQNNILFYDPQGGCHSGEGHSGVVAILPGNNNGEKIWNWFATAGIAGVSDNENVIAGIIGNLMTESSLNPFVVSNKGYYGLYQAGGGRAETLKAAFENAGLNDKWRATSASDDEIDTAIDVTLTTLTTSDDGSFRTFVNRLSSVADTPEAYAELFLVTVERAVYYDGCGGGCQEILDEGAKGYSNGKPYQGASGRRTNAGSALTTYAGGGGGEAVTRIRSDVRSVACSTDGYAGSSELVSGGMTLAEAKAFMEPYRAIRPRNYHEAGSYLGRWSINNVDGCASDLENCVAFTQYFICEYGKVCMPLPGGGKVVDTLLASGRGFINGGTTPRPYAVFSSATHTGIVLGIDQERGKIIIGEAGCGEKVGYDWTTAHEYSLSQWTDGSHKYAYTDNIIGM